MQVENAGLWLCGEGREHGGWVFNPTADDRLAEVEEQSPRRGQDGLAPLSRWGLGSAAKGEKPVLHIRDATGRPAMAYKAMLHKSHAP